MVINVKTNFNIRRSLCNDIFIFAFHQLLSKQLLLLFSFCCNWHEILVLWRHHLVNMWTWREIDWNSLRSEVGQSIWDIPTSKLVWNAALDLKWICRPMERCKMGTTAVRRQFCSWRSNPDRMQQQQPVIMKCSRRSGLAASGVFDQDCCKVHVGVTLTWLYPEDCSYWAVVCSAAASDVWRCRPLQMKSLLEKKLLPAKLLYRVDWHMMSVLDHQWSGLLFDVTIPRSVCSSFQRKILSNTRHRL